MTYQTCGEISCEECNDRYEKALARIAELEKQLLLAQTKVRTVDAALTARNGALEQMVREFLAEDVEAAGMSPTGNPCHNHRKGACEMTDSPFMTVSELKAKLEAERDTERELTATYAKYIAAIPALCRGEEVPCAMHVSQPIKELRARIAELEQMVLEWQPIETAPRDGERDMLLGYWWRNPFAHDTAQPIFKQCVGRWTDFNGGGWITANGGNVTHWQPLPQPPRKDGAK